MTSKLLTFRFNKNYIHFIQYIKGSEIAITPEWFQEFNNYRFRYQFNQKSLIGQGSFGKVYRCHSQLDKQFYCIKKIEVRNKSDGLHEIQALAEISKIYHPNIVRYFGSWMEAMPTKSIFVLILNKVINHQLLCFWPPINKNFFAMIRFRFN